MYPSKSKFREIAQSYNLIPVYKEILADLDTPVSAYLKIASQSKYSFLLESVEGKGEIARYSFLGTTPFIIFQSKGRYVEIKDVKSNKNTKVRTNHPLIELKKLLNRFHTFDVGERFSGGAVGFISYDLVRFFEKLPDETIDDLKLPDTFFLLPDTILIFDHLKHKIKIVANALIEEKNKIDEAYYTAIQKIDDIINKLNSPTLPLSVSTRKNNKLIIQSNLEKHQFKNIVRAAKKYITQGDIIQVVLSQRFKVNITQDSFNIYRALRSINPSPYLYYLNFDNLKIIGSSPEMLVRLQDGEVQTRPIAGTRRRGKDDIEDKKLENELLQDKKEYAEHLMLVDLARNDLGRVCEYGTVKVTEFMIIEKYSHVMHIVSTVSGKLKRGYDAFDVIKATFPAGTVTGAPKVRAMEIIEELENIKRGPYAGSVCYFSFTGNMDSAITIRTIIIKDNTAFIQAGAGIVAYSKPENEYKETINKATALIKAIEDATKLCRINSTAPLKLYTTT